MTNTDTRRAQRDNLLKLEAAASRKQIFLIITAVLATKQRVTDDPTVVQPALHNQLRGIRRTVAQLADTFYAADPTFDRQAFITNCGYGASE